ncbi:MAG TPA: oxygen-independent coproporphyrinogen III oxidase [Candidatus Merdicola faecigallinarum]|uniref:Heme chaperone HemW n=1 Tax=Candidatus Merdicola faecigallinarum TaxID=2840862 RepID=A0A9D1S9K3_9FIRM|nr:oxygen-independent coproporphyrinogen III oxidase [Candidatus Merdicola faecigallinarum]
MKELGIYIHIPFCKQKCKYCDFISYSNKEEKIKEYIKALQKEIQIKLKKYQKEYLVDTIYLGGGTPSYIEPEKIEDIIKTVKNIIQMKENVEITIEVNPGTVTKRKLEIYKNVGINRLSIGLQTTNHERLKQIGRIHTYEMFLETYQMAKEVGFTNINVDLMIGLPKQRLKEIETDLENILLLQPNHISIYSLIVEEGTVLEKELREGKLILPEEDLEREMYWKVKEILEKNEYEHYEISNFAKKGYQSKHNWNCWNQKEYLGFGIAAHSYMNNIRYSNIDNLQEYIEQMQYAEKIEDLKKIEQIQEVQNKEEKQKEYMLLGLRKLKGISIQEFKKIFLENPIYLYRKELDKLVKEELIEVDLDSIRLSNRGLDLANLVWEEFI